MQCCLNTPATSLRRKNSTQCCPRGSRQHFTGNNPVQCHLNTIWSFLGDFYFEPVNFLILTSCYRCLASIVQISLILHKKNSGPTSNKKTRLHGTQQKYISCSDGVLIIESLTAAYRKVLKFMSATVFHINKRN